METAGAVQHLLMTLASLLSAADLTLESARALEVARQLFRKGSADFADCLHVASATQVVEEPLWTFDKGASKISGAQSCWPRLESASGRSAASP